jgi:hypothetical protein
LVSFSVIDFYGIILFAINQYINGGKELANKVLLVMDVQEGTMQRLGEKKEEFLIKLEETIGS